MLLSLHAPEWMMACKKRLFFSRAPGSSGYSGSGGWQLEEIKDARRMF